MEAQERRGEGRLKVLNSIINQRNTLGENPTYTNVFGYLSN